MKQNKISLASDNWSPSHPRIFEYIATVNQGPVAPYGADIWTEKALNIFETAFQKECKAFMISSGTGTNVLALKIARHSHQSIICTDIAHIHFQESGAAEAIVGCKLLTALHENGKITPTQLLKTLRKERAFKHHSTQPRVLSITQPTEIGTVYQLKELQTLSKLCKQENLLLHIDGSRLYNASIALDVPLHEIIEASGVDILSLGGTKNGLMSAEALVIFNKELYDGSDYLHKQTLQLTSKMRYLSAQFIPFFEENLWKELAQNANQKAKGIEAIISQFSQLSLIYPVETNQIFFQAPPHWIPFIQEKVNCYLWNEDNNEIRLVTSWDTSKEDLISFKAVLTEVFQNNTN